VILLTAKIPPPSTSNSSASTAIRNANLQLQNKEKVAKHRTERKQLQKKKKNQAGSLIQYVTETFSINLFDPRTTGIVWELFIPHCST